LTAEGKTLGTEIGRYSADFVADVRGYVPVFAYGVSERMTLGIAVPIMTGRTRVKVGFKANAEATDFLQRLESPEYSLHGFASQVETQMLTATAELDGMLEDYGYAPIEDWTGQGIGDTTVALKHLWVSTRSGQIGGTYGVVVPTGRQDDPNVLTDVPFGDGQPDLQATAAAEQKVVELGWLTTSLGSHLRYTHQIATTKTVRRKTEKESVLVPIGKARVKPGDIWEVGGGLETEWWRQWQLGVSYRFAKKFTDVVRSISDERLLLTEKNGLELRTATETQRIETGFGYGTVTRFLAGTARVPFLTKLTYSRQLYSENTPVQHETHFDVNFFF
jgi:hypothetical protein